MSIKYRVYKLIGGIIKLAYYVFRQNIVLKTICLWKTL